MSYIILYIIASLFICFLLSILLIKSSFLLWNHYNTRNVSADLSIKNVFMIFIPTTFVLWIGLTIFILANLKMH